MTIRTLEGRLVTPIEVLEGNPLRITALLTKISLTLPDSPFVLSDLVSPGLRGTIFSIDNAGHPIVNGVNAVDLIATGRATLDTLLGELVVLLPGADNAVLDNSLAVERHCFRIAAAYSTVPALSAIWEIEIRVRNALTAPTP